MPIIRTRAEIDDLLGGPKPAEGALLAACEAGVVCWLGDGNLPSEDTDPNRVIRADVLRYLILGGCEDCRVQGQGVRVLGAHVTGTLDLSYQTARGVTLLVNTWFENGINATQTNLAGLNLTGSHIPSLNAQSAEVKGNVVLGKINSTGEIRLFGAIIGGQLSCNGAKLSNENGFALSAQSAEVKGGVFFDDLSASGEISLSGAIIGGQLSCEGAKFSNEDGVALNAHSADVKGGVFFDGLNASGEISLSGAIIRAQLSCEGATFSNESGFALNAQAVTIREGLIWRGDTTCSTSVANFTAAKIADLVDDLSCWPERGRLRLNGLTYDRIYGDLDVSARLSWLESGSYNGGTFTPQPYTQLAKVYRTMGRDGDARRVLCARERLEHRDLRRRKRVTPDGSVSVGFLSLWRDLCHPARLLWSVILRYTIGYGFAPYRALWWLGGIWLLATLLAHQAWTDGDFAPNSDVLQTSAAWLALTDNPNPAETWSTTAPGRDWETFNPYAYAADLVIPIIDLNQTDTWTPSTNRGPWGQRLWRYGFLLNLAGWIITALGAAALTGIVQKERD